MSEFLEDKEKKKRLIKDIIRQLHKGLSIEEAKERILREVGSVSSTEIAEIEQSLIDEGMQADEIKKFCNVHALLFESSLKETVSEEGSSNHPVNLFKQENREIEKRLDRIKKIIEDKDSGEFKPELGKALDELAKIETHYVRKEQLLFPYLERYGFMGPSKVMWGKHNEIRGLLKSCLSELEKITDKDSYIKERLKPLIEEIEGMIFKEENILFPSSVEKLTSDDWVDILKESSDIGYVFIEEPALTSSIIDEIKGAVSQDPQIEESGRISFPTGGLGPAELMHILNNIPVELTFVDKDDRVKYFTDHKDRIFVRTRSVIGREVRNCHPPQSLDKVERIVQDFKSKKRDHADFWIDFEGKFVYIKFIAIRDENQEYLGTLEVTMDATKIRSLKGEKRLLDEGD